VFKCIPLFWQAAASDVSGLFQKLFCVQAIDASLASASQIEVFLVLTTPLPGSLVSDFSECKIEALNGDRMGQSNDPPCHPTQSRDLILAYRVKRRYADIYLVPP
jgi:hypothetical protein